MAVRLTAAVAMDLLDRMSLMLILFHPARRLMTMTAAAVVTARRWTLPLAVAIAVSRLWEQREP